MISVLPIEKVCNVFTVVNGLSTMKVKKAALDAEKRLNIEQNLASYEFGNMLIVYSSLRKLWTHSGCSNKAQIPARNSPDSGTNIWGKGEPWLTVKHSDLAHTIINNWTLNYDKNWHLLKEDTPAGGVRSPLHCWALVEVWMQSLTESSGHTVFLSKPQHKSGKSDWRGRVEVPVETSPGFSWHDFLSYWDGCRTPGSHNDITVFRNKKGTERSQSTNEVSFQKCHLDSSLFSFSRTMVNRVYRDGSM